MDGHDDGEGFVVRPVTSREKVSRRAEDLDVEVEDEAKETNETRGGSRGGMEYRCMFPTQTSPSFLLDLSSKNRSLSLSMIYVKTTPTYPSKKECRNKGSKLLLNTTFPRKTKGEVTDICRCVYVEFCSRTCVIYMCYDRQLNFLSFVYSFLPSRLV